MDSIRIDKFLNSVNLAKSRTIAQDMCENNAILINGIACKSKKEIKINDIITIKLLDKQSKYLILKLPLAKSTPKKDKSLYVSEL